MRLAPHHLAVTVGPVQGEDSVACLGHSPRGGLGPHPTDRTVNVSLWAPGARASPTEMPSPTLGLQGLPMGRRNRGVRARTRVRISLGWARSWLGLWPEVRALYLSQLPLAATQGKVPLPPTRQSPKDPHSLWEVPTRARLSEDPELSLWELSWLTLRPGRWGLRTGGDEAGASGSGGLSCELHPRNREPWACRASAVGGGASQSGWGQASHSCPDCPAPAPGAASASHPLGLQ